MLDCAQRRPGMLLFRPPETPPQQPARLSYHLARAPDEPRESLSVGPPDHLVHLARWNGASYDALAECWEHGLDVAVSSGARIAALVRNFSPTGAHHLTMRRHLFRAQRNPAWVLHTVRALIDGKIHNQLALLRRYHDRPDQAWMGDQPPEIQTTWGERYTDALMRLRRNRQVLRSATSIASIRGIEGHAARSYFGSWPPLIGDDIFHRHARRAADPCNLLLDISYARLAHRVTLHLLDQGFDIAAGMLHSDDDGRPSLALDLMEPLRPLVADRFSLRLIRRSRTDWFVQYHNRWDLSVLGRREIKDHWQSWLQGNSKRPGMEQAIATTVTRFRHWICHGEPLEFPLLR